MALLFDVEDHIATLKFNRPEAMNAMDPETYSDLSRAWIEVRDNPDIWTAIITGTGDRAFTAGADLKKTVTRERDAYENWLTQKEQILNRGLEVWKPIIAAINGYCLAGGMTLLFATDIRIAADHAQFGISEVKRSIIPSNGGTQRATKNMSYCQAMELLLVGDMISAEKALSWGLINEIVPKESLMDRTMEVAHRLCENPPLAMQAIKELAVRSQYLNIVEGLRLEQLMGNTLRQTEDSKEGPRAFAEKRKAIYHSR